jgi:hypothetical protein
MTIKELNDQVNAKLGIPGGWPSDMTYQAIDKANAVEVIISTTNTASEGVLKKIDPWGFAFLSEVQNITGKKSVEMKFSLSIPISHDSKAARQYEALKRRLSYLASANNLTITLEKNGSPSPLYTYEELQKRPAKEVVRADFKQRGDDDVAGRLEKDFQTYLFGKGLHDKSEEMKDRTNERLALFGPDFIRIGKIKKAAGGKRYKVEREFPTGAFLTNVKKSNRILPTEYVDLVTINRKGELSLIELKFDDPKLEVIPQVLNYALFFNAYRSQLTTLIDKRLGCSTEKCDLVTYLVSNTFHVKFDKVFPYYAKGQLVLKQVIMGYMPELKKE